MIINEKMDFKGIVTGHNEKFYQFRSKQIPENLFTVPVPVIHYCEFSDEMKDKDGFLKNGTELHLREVPLPNGAIHFYPRHEFYPPKKENIINNKRASISSLKDNIVPLKVNTPEVLGALRDEFCEHSDRFDVQVRKETMRILSEGNLDESCNHLRRLLNKPIFPQENGQIEYKSSFLNPRETDKNYQLRELVKILVGFANSDTHRGTLIVGVTDNQEVCGVENDFVQFGEQFNREKFTAMFINLYKQLTSGQLMMDTHLEWNEIENHLICRISVDYHGDVVLMNGTHLYVRKESGNHLLKGDDVLAFIRQKVSPMNQNNVN